MDGKIKLLLQEEIEKIAAGEVIERPSSVVKELVENSLDAGAKKISIFIEGCGRNLIRVVDDGCGMGEKDAAICFARYATSKIEKLQDIDQISSYGFRGEGLASIAAVSAVTVITRTVLDECATKVVYQGGTVLSIEKVAGNYGTDIFLKNLFYNAPVRLKFMRSDDTEWHQIQLFVSAVALSNPTVSFQLFRDGQLSDNFLSVDTFSNRIKQVWDYTISENIVPLKFERTLPAGGKIVLDGITTNSQVWRYNRNNLYFFVNGRWIKNAELGRAVLRGYDQSLPAARFPVSVVFITITGQPVDVNIHPRKEEVRFLNNGVVEDSIVQAIRQSLSFGVIKGARVTSVEEFTTPLSYQSDKKEDLFYTPPFFLKKSSEFFKESFNVQKENEIDGCSTISLECGQVGTSSLFNPSRHSENLQVPLFEKKVGELKVIGQILSTYILCESEMGLKLIDQHAAHERILYEKMKGRFGLVEPIGLLIPETIVVTSAQHRLLLVNAELLASQGVLIEDFGEGLIRVIALPIEGARIDIREFCYAIVEFFERDAKAFSHDEMRRLIFEHIHSHLACKSAVKAGDVLVMPMMEQLVKDLAVTQNSHMCIHGRPTSWLITKREIELAFRR